MDWRERLLTDTGRIHALLARARRVAVLGIKPDSMAHAPGHFVPAYLQAHGYEILPVPVRGEEGTILGQPVYRSVAEVPGDVDVVQVFRKPEDIDAHVEDILAKLPRAVWFQAGIRNDAAAERLARAGIDVVQDHCMKVEHTRMQR